MEFASIAVSRRKEFKMKMLNRISLSLIAAIAGLAIMPAASADPGGRAWHDRGHDWGRHNRPVFVRNPIIVPRSPVIVYGGPFYYPPVPIYYSPFPPVYARSPAITIGVAIPPIVIPLR